MLNLDTNILLMAVGARLNRQEQRLLADDFWCISDIVLWEIERLSEKSKITTGLDHPLMRAVLDRVTVLPITIEVCRAVRRLDFTSDPVDQLVAATSLAHDIPLVTRDMKLLASKVVPLALR
jgi:predicted nucleic acid-binding protein